VISQEQSRQRRTPCGPGRYRPPYWLLLCAMSFDGRGLEWSRSEKSLAAPECERRLERMRYRTVRGNKMKC
jgi:hypothetical protein